MRIFRIIHDTNNIQLLNMCDRSQDRDGKFDFNCTSKKKDWEDYLFYIWNPKTKPKSFFSSSGYLTFDKKTLELCSRVFEKSGEILPIKVERSEDVYIVNILECMNGLDYAKTIWESAADGTKGKILKYALHADRVKSESSLFKIPEEITTDIFCYADVKDREEEFYYIYHDNN